MSVLFLKKGLVAGITGLCFFAGCSNVTMLRVEELNRIEARVDSLNMELVSLQTKMMAEEKKQAELLRMIRADQQVRFSELQRTTNALAGSIYESQERLSQIDQKTRDIKKRWDERAVADSMMAVSSDAEVEGLFEIAMGDFNAGRYEVAQSGFADIVNRFAEHQLAEESEYWIAECYYAEKKMDDAQTQYMQYIKNHPEGSKICVSLFKLGLVYDKLDKEKSMQMVWEQLIELCPESEETAAAKARLGR